MCWWYAARLPNQRVIVSLMSDRKLLQQYGLLQLPNWTAYLQKTQYVQELSANASSQSRLLIKPAYSQYLDQITGDGWLAVGDAACTLDPLSSAGIHKALESGIKAADAIANYFKGNSQALSTYESQALHQFELYLEDRRKYYAMETRWSNSPFWKSRRGGITLAPSQPLLFQESPQITKTLKGLTMYLPAKDLRLLCNFCTSGNIASDVVSKFLSETHHQVSAYRVIEALQYLLEKEIISALPLNYCRN
ncbi:tryptophan 7-halogenase [Moorena producens]